MKISIDRGIFENPFFSLLFIFPYVSVYAIPLNLGHILDFMTVIYVPILGIIYILCWNDCSHIAFIGLLYSVVIVISTYLNNPSGILYALVYGARMFSFFMLFDLFLSQKKTVLLRVFDNYLFFLLLINLICQIFDQEHFGYTNSGNYQNFLTNDNSLPYYCFALLGLIIANKASYNKWGVYDFLKILVSYLVLLRAWCAAGIISYTVCIMLLVFASLKGIPKWLNMTCGIIFYSIANIFFSILGDFNLFNTITDRIFGKTIGISRLSIWSRSVYYIKRKIWLGYGTGHGINGMGEFAHNFNLEFLMTGGVALFLSYALLLIADDIQSIKYNSKTIKLLCCVFLCLEMAFLTEGTIVDPCMYIVLILIFFARNYDESSMIADNWNEYSAHMSGVVDDR